MLRLGRGHGLCHSVWPHRCTAPRMTIPRFTIPVRPSSLTNPHLPARPNLTPPPTPSGTSCPAHTHTATRTHPNLRSRHTVPGTDPGHPAEPTQPNRSNRIFRLHAPRLDSRRPRPTLSSPTSSQPHSVQTSSMIPTYSVLTKPSTSRNITTAARLIPVSVPVSTISAPMCAHLPSPFVSALSTSVPTAARATSQRTLITQPRTPLASRYTVDAGPETSSFAP
ncbi:hypothetical protein BV25DRAFT_144327 [Artomyces pyxidatus]|uniref:Uncharacterized protein n=1 Tax=Artomyces pyxidatus TaxID=48021 RepID=A0ACB8T9L2_9AGAM|nr:hypothetical protein BV25DRAFT_144327 [Artomyces pyxidatus]